MFVLEIDGKITTQEVLMFKSYIEKTWKKFDVKLEVPLRGMLPEPQNKGLKHIWQYGRNDLVVYDKGEPVCVIEPGGSAHFKDERQMKNDKRKWKIHELNGIKLLRIANGVFEHLSNKQKRKLLGKFIFGKSKVM